jgi:hypothetical protein
MPKMFFFLSPANYYYFFPGKERLSSMKVFLFPAILSLQFMCNSVETQNVTLTIDGHMYKPQGPLSSLYNKQTNRTCRSGGTPDFLLDQQQKIGIQAFPRFLSKPKEHEKLIFLVGARRQRVAVVVTIFKMVGGDGVSFQMLSRGPLGLFALTECLHQNTQTMPLQH